MAQEEGVRDGGMEGKDTKEDPALAAPPQAQEGSMVQMEFVVDPYTFYNRC